MDILYFIPQFLYYILACCLQVLDFAQLLFRKIIGLDTYGYNGTVAVNPIGFEDGSSGDLVLQIFHKIFMNEDFSVLKIAFISMVVLGSMLLVITSIAAIIRIEYNPNKKADGKKDWGKAGVFWSMIKAVIAFFAIPVICYFGIYVGNIALYGIDQATSPNTTNLSALDESVTKYLKPSVTAGQGGEGRVISYDYYIFWGQKSSSKYTPMSGTAIRLCLNSANKVRRDNSFYDNLMKEDADGKTINFGIFNQYSDPESAANAVDTMFMLNARLKNPQEIDTSYQGSGIMMTYSGTVEYFNRYEVGLVSYYYNLWYFNWPVAILYIVIVGKIFLGLIFGLISRIYIVFGLLLVSPIVASLWPLDGGEGIKGWRKKFVGNVAGAYASILAMNAFYLIYPVINSFSFFGSLNASTKIFGVADYLFQLFFLIAGLLTIKKFDAMFAQFISGDDKAGIMASGSEMANEAMKAAGSVMGAARVGAAATIGAAKIGFGAARALSAPITSAITNGRQKAKLNKARKKSDEAIEKGGYRDKASRTDAEIDSSVLDSMKGTQEYNDEVTGETNKAIDSAFQDYQSSGGSMTREQWEHKEDVDRAQYDWNHMSVKERMGKKKDDFMRERTGFADWSKTLKAAKEDEKKRKSGIAVDTTSYSAVQKKAESDAKKAVDERIAQTLKDGRGDGALAQKALTEQRAARQERSQAQSKIDELSADYKRQLEQYKHSPTYGQRVKRAAFGGLRNIGSGLGNIGGIFTANPKK